jgi:hypothetical protein
MYIYIYIYSNHVYINIRLLRAYKKEEGGGYAFGLETLVLEGWLVWSPPRLSKCAVLDCMVLPIGPLRMGSVYSEYV